MTPLVLKSYKGVLVLLHYKYIGKRHYHAMQSTKLCDEWLSECYEWLSRKREGEMNKRRTIWIGLATCKWGVYASG